MARLAGVDLPKNKRIGIGLTYIYGIGPFVAQELLNSCNIENTVRVKDLSEGQVVELRSAIREYVIEGDLKRQENANIRRLKDTGSYRGARHKRKLPVRGQRTHTNARTKRGKKIAVAGKKKVTK
ncbi:30S ribosomal protein S13 [bacterium]|jgi:small subunit ribosomal protein S13|nr:30S ribosomal protein S13 [bacterium]